MRGSNHNPLLIPMVIIGGVMGLLAGYGVLALINGQKVLQTAESPKETVPPRVSPLVHQPTPRIESAIIPYRDPPIVDTPPIVRQPETAPITHPEPPVMRQPVAPKMPPVVQRPKPDAKVMVRNSATTLPKPSAIVTLTLDKPIIRVAATVPAEIHGTPLCDVGLSHDLLNRIDNSPGYTLVAEKLGNRGDYLAELAAGIQGGGAAIEIQIIQRNNTVFCELHPKFSLPSGDIQPLTISRGTKIHNELERSLTAVETAKKTLPTMRSQLSQLESNRTSLQQLTTGNGSTPAQTGAGRTTAIMQLSSVRPAIAKLSKQIASAEDLVANETSYRADLNVLNLIAKYSQGIASVSTVYVRIYVGDETIAGAVK